MSVDIEETLRRELRQVADDLRVPAMPAVPREDTHRWRTWQPLLAAAAVVLVLAGVLAVLTTTGGGERPAPAPQPDRPDTIATTAPTVPYVVDQRLTVGGERVPGTWWSVRGTDTGWLALRTDGSWWWGRGAESFELPGLHDVAPVISPGGRYVAQLDAAGGAGRLSALDTATGQVLGQIPVTRGRRGDGSLVTIRAVTDDGAVVAQGTQTAVLWRPLDGGTVDLTETAPGQDVLSGTVSGLVVSDGEEFYLAEVSDAGELIPLVDLPAHDDLAVSPGGTWMVWTPFGTTQGDVFEIPTLQVQTVADGEPVTLDAPSGWGFQTRAWTWEDDGHLIAPVLAAEEERMARCDVEAARCVLVDAR